jgi:hypothetical protein
MVVIVDDAAQHLFLSDGTFANRVLLGNRNTLLNPLMRAREVVIGYILDEDALKMSGTEDQDVVQAFFTAGSDPAFSVRIRVRCLERSLNSIDP